MSNSGTEDLKPPCTVCGDQPGKPHEGRQHAYTVTPGELITPEEQMKAQGRPPGMVVRQGIMPNSDATGRLVEVLLEKGLFTPGEALYIAGMGPKPAVKSGYQDPVM